MFDQRSREAYSAYATFAQEKDFQRSRAYKKLLSRHSKAVPARGFGGGTVARKPTRPARSQTGFVDTTPIEHLEHTTITDMDNNLHENGNEIEICSPAGKPEMGGEMIPNTQAQSLGALEPTCQTDSSREQAIDDNFDVSLPTNPPHANAQNEDTSRTEPEEKVNFQQELDEIFETGRAEINAQERSE